MRLTRGLARVSSFAVLGLFVASGASAGQGTVLVGHAATAAATLAALDLDELPPPAPPSPDRRITTPDARTLEPVGDIPPAPAP